MSELVKAGGTTMNKWKQFAEMLGLELEQEFVLTDIYGNRTDEFTYTITEDGIFYKSKISNDLFKTELVDALLNGCIKAVPNPWKPKKGEKYWFYLYGTKEVIDSRWSSGTYDLLLWKVGNCFKTDEEAATKGKEIMEQIQKEYEEA